MTVEILLVILSLALLFVGAEGLVRGSASLALRAGLTPLMIGLTVVAFGTSSPELVVSLKAAFSGQGDIAVGNVVGSNIFNIGVILGLTALICPMAVQRQIIRIDLPIMLLAAVLLPLLLIGGLLSRLEGGLLIVGLLAYLGMTVYMARRMATPDVAEEFAEGTPQKTSHWAIDLLYALVGLALLVVGSQLLVDNSVEIARSFGISEAVIGLTIIAAGTSMPELATSIVAALRQQPDIAIGNVVGSNIFNILAILGISSATVPLVSEGVQLLDYAVMIGISVLLVPFLWTGLKLRRLEGAVLVVVYGVYLAVLWPK